VNVVRANFDNIAASGAPSRLPFRQGLLAARGHIVFILALLAAFALIFKLEGLADNFGAGADPSTILAKESERLPLRAPHALNPAELNWGRTAWRYFATNISPSTGLANAADKYPSTTMWDVGSFLLAMIAAERTGIIDRAEFDSRTGFALASLGRMPLFDGALPNKAYNTDTLEMVDYDNHPTARGIGWSAIDLARLYVPLGIIARDYPGHSAAVQKILSRWDMNRVVVNGSLYGASVDNGQTKMHQEGRIGYEEYAAKAFIRGGHDAFAAWRTDDTMVLHKVSGIKVPVDNRAVDDWGAQVYSTSEPYVLDGLEFGFDTRSRVLAEQLYRAQESRYRKTGTLTAVSEGHIDRTPHFLYSTVYGNGSDWAVLTDKGERHDKLRTLSTKIAFALDALYNLPYTTRLLDAAAPLNDPKGGWLEGRYEADGKPNKIQTTNTNAIILESLHFRAFGPMVGRGVH